MKINVVNNSVAKSFNFKYSKNQEEDILSYFKEKKIIDEKTYKLMSAYSDNPKFVSKLPLTAKLYSDLFFTNVHDIKSNELLKNMHDVTFGHMVIVGIGDIGELMIEAAGELAFSTDDFDETLRTLLSEQEDRIEKLAKMYAENIDEKEVFHEAAEELRIYIYTYIENEL